MGVQFPLANSVLWKAEKFNHVRRTSVQLRTDPIGKGLWKEATPRSAALVELVHVGSGQHVVVCSTHLCGGRFEDPQFAVESLGGRNVRAEQVQELQKGINRSSGCASCVIAGDFNVMLDGFHEGSPFRDDAQRYFQLGLHGAAMKQAMKYGYAPNDADFTFDNFYVPFQTQVHKVLQELGYTSAYGKSDADVSMKSSMFAGCVDWIYIKGLGTMKSERVIAAIAQDLSDHDAVMVKLCFI